MYVHGEEMNRNMRQADRSTVADRKRAGKAHGRFAETENSSFSGESETMVSRTSHPMIVPLTHHTQPCATTCALSTRGSLGDDLVQPAGVAPNHEHVYLRHR